MPSNSLYYGTFGTDIETLAHVADLSGAYTGDYCPLVVIGLRCGLRMVCWRVSCAYMFWKIGGLV